MSSEAELRQILAAVMQRLEAVTARLEKIEGSAPAVDAPAAAAPVADEMPRAQKAFMDLIDEHLKPQVEKAKNFDETLAQCMEDFLAMAQKEAEVVGLAAKSKKPTQENLMKIVQPISEMMMKVGEYKDKNFRSPYINYFTAIAEAVPVFGWVCVEPTPGPYVADLIPGSEFYTNKILVQTKGKEQEKYDWALGFIKFLKEIVVYIKQYHTTGLTWNPKGGDAMEAPKAEPKPEPPKEEKKEEPKAEKPAVNTAGLFAELNKGTGISGGLKHVTADMKTKNMKPEDKKPLEPKAKAPAAPKAAAKPAVQKPPKMEKIGNKWDISYQNGNKTMEVEGDFRDSIYCFKCENSALRVKGKINCISIDNCKKLTLICDTVVSYIELVNCNSVDIRIIELTPTVNIDKSQSVVVHLSASCLEGNTTVNTSKCDAINMAFPNPEDPEDEVEYAVPEQFFTVVKENKLYPQIYFHDKSSYWFPK